MQFECFYVRLSHILQPKHPLQVGLQCFQLEIIAALIVGYYGYSVLELEGVGIGSVVYQYHTGETPIDHSQILYVHALRCWVAVFPVKTMLNIFVIGV